MSKQSVLDEIRKLVPEMIARELISVQPMPESAAKAFAELVELLRDTKLTTKPKESLNDG